MTPTEIFVYGTLRQGLPDHGRLCRGVTAVTPARVAGRLYLASAGYPILIPLSGNFVYSASPDCARDETVRAKSVAPRDPPVLSLPWRWINGDLLALADAGEAFPPLDDWEGFTPGEGGLYRRVLLPVFPDSRPARMVWTYIMDTPPADARPLEASCWRPPGR